jgi:hypothetical protein
VDGGLVAAIDIVGETEENNAEDRIGILARFQIGTLAEIIGGGPEVGLEFFELGFGHAEKARSIRCPAEAGKPGIGLLEKIPDQKFRAVLNRSRRTLYRSGNGNRVCTLKRRSSFHQSQDCLSDRFRQLCPGEDPPSSVRVLARRVNGHLNGIFVFWLNGYGCNSFPPPVTENMFSTEPFKAPSVIHARTGMISPALAQKTNPQRP